MNYKIFLSTILTLALVGFALYPTTVGAYKGDPEVIGPNYSEERHEAMEAAFENEDYEAWKTLMQGRGRMSQVVTEENFSKFAQAHELAGEGKFDEARKLRQELGLGMGGNSEGCMRYQDNE